MANTMLSPRYRRHDLLFIKPLKSEEVVKRITRIFVATIQVMKHRHLMLQLVALVLTCLMIWTSFTASSAADTLDVYFFHSDTCPHCAKQKPLMQKIAQYNQDIDVHLIEVEQDPQTWQIFRARYQIASSAVPRTFVGENSFVGYSESDGPLEYVPIYAGYIGYRNQIIQAIADASGHPVNLSAVVDSQPFHFPWFILALPTLYLLSFPYFQPKFQRIQIKRYWLGGLSAVCLLSLFIILHLTPDSAIQPMAQSLPFPLFVAMIALADGFNPCAFTVLIILLSLLTYTQRKRDMVMVGGTFILTSATMYFLFIMLMISIGAILFEHYGKLFLLILGIGITLAGLINIKDYFWFKQGVSLSLSPAQQRTISQRAGKIVRTLGSDAQTQQMGFVSALAGTVALAIFVNLIELGCTAILPMVYMTSLVNYCQANPGYGRFLCYSFWTVIYAIIYVIPLLLILSSFIYTFESTRLTEAQGRGLKLFAGLFMLFFGLVMILRPELLMLG